jgi:hypothetical protein
VVALGGSLDVVKIMADACPEALGERLSGRRTLLHYAISEGVDVEVSTTNTEIIDLTTMCAMCNSETSSLRSLSSLCTSIRNI